MYSIDILMRDHELSNYFADELTWPSWAKTIFFFVLFVCPNRIPRCQYQSTAVDANDLFTAKKPTATKFSQLNALSLSKYLASSFWEHGIVFLRNLRVLAIIYKPVTSLTTPHTYIHIHSVSAISFFLAIVSILLCSRCAIIWCIFILTIRIKS